MSVDVQASPGLARRQAKHWYQEAGDGGEHAAVTVDGVEPSPAGQVGQDVAWGDDSTPPVDPNQPSPGAPPPSS